MVAIPQQALLAGKTPSSSDDPFFSIVKLLMGFEGTNGSTGAPGMTDESSAAHGNAVVNGTAQISTAQFKFGTSSLSLSGSSPASIDFLDHADWHLGAGNFTVEGFIRPSSVSGNQFIIGQWGLSGNLGWELWMSGASLSWNVSTTGTDNLSDMAGGSIAINTQSAVCVDYNGTKYRLYLNGTMVASSLTARTIFAPAVPLTIGANSIFTSFNFAGWVDELRLTKGVARYASDSGYTVPTAAFPRS